jgi:hypothetical protein
MTKFDIPVKICVAPAENYRYLRKFLEQQLPVGCVISPHNHDYSYFITGKPFTTARGRYIWIPSLIIRYDLGYNPMVVIYREPSQQRWRWSQATRYKNVDHFLQVKLPECVQQFIVL